MCFLEIAGISKRAENDLVLKVVSFSQERSQKIAIAGETGSGKSTLLKIIAGLVQPDAGEVLLEKERVLGPEEKLLPGHSQIAYLSQHFELRNNYRVEEILEMANKISDKEAETIYEICRITHLLKRKTNQLSGGEKQRIATARLLISMPELLLLDEPYSNLDMFHKNILKSVIRDISETLKITCILISHDPQDLLSWADEILVMKDGQIIQKGTPEQIYNQPVDEYTGGLFGGYNLITPDKAIAFNSFGKITNGKALFIRPENLKISTEEDNGLTGKVKNINFMGSYYEVEVAVRGNIITVKTSENNITNEDTVYVSLGGNRVWYV